jgi:hypothetical protein
MTSVDDVMTRIIKKRNSIFVHRERRIPHLARPSLTLCHPFCTSFCILFQVVVITLLLPCYLHAQPSLQSVPNLNGRHFKITVVQENGFLDILEDESDDDDNDAADATTKTTRATIDHNSHRSYHDNLRHVRYQGYLIDMIYALAEKANFSFTLLPPSGMGSACVPRIYTTKDANSNSSLLYDRIYRTQYNCGASDVNDYTIFSNNTSNSTYNETTVATTTDMYLGMFYVSPARQLVNHFTIPFVPPFSGTLAMFGTATNIADFTSLVLQQQQQQQHEQNSGTSNTTYDSSIPSSSVPSSSSSAAAVATIGVQVTANTTCGPAGTALIQAVQEAYPGLTVKGVYDTTPQTIFQHFYNGSCTVYIIDGPVAAQFVLRQSRKQQQQQRQPNPCTDQYGHVRNRMIVSMTL